MRLQYKFQLSDTQRLKRVVELVAMRRSFAFIFILCGLIFIYMGLGIVAKERFPGVLIIGIGIAAIFKTIRIVSRVSKLRTSFSRAIKTAPNCVWVLDDAGICLAPDHMLPWKNFKQATFCSDGAILTGKNFVWIPSEAFQQTGEAQVLRKQLAGVGVRCVDRYGK